MKPTFPRPDLTAWALLSTFSLLVGAACGEALLDPRVGWAGLTWLGRALVLGGALCTVLARVVLGANYAPTAHHPSAQQTLVRTGIYRWFDHPMYAGNLASALGLLLALDARWSWAALPPFLAAQVWRVRREERFLRERFGPSWSARGHRQLVAS